MGFTATAYGMHYVYIYQYLVFDNSIDMIIDATACFWYQTSNPNTIRRLEYL